MHSHSHDLHPSRHARRALMISAVAGAVAIVLGMVILRPQGAFSSPEALKQGPVYDAEITDVRQVACAEGQQTPTGELCFAAIANLEEGPDKGSEVTIDLPESPTTPVLVSGDKVVMAYEDDALPDQRYQFVDRSRKPPLLVLAVLFGIAVVVLGRLRGLAALAGLGISVVVLAAFVLPAILDARSPVAVAVVGAAAIAYVALYLAHGFNTMTTVALLGALSSLALTGVLARVFVVAAQLSGYASEEAVLVKLASGRIDAAGLVLAGIVIGALGALDDVTVTQASAVGELRDANPELTRRDLYRAGLRIGRDHVASTVNTLLLAYAGAALPLMIYFVVSEQSLVTVANQEIVATEIIRTLVGSIGLVAAVPITTWLAAVVASTTRAKPAPTPSE